MAVATAFKGLSALQESHRDTAIGTTLTVEAMRNESNRGKAAAQDATLSLYDEAKSAHSGAMGEARIERTSADSTCKKTADTTARALAVDQATIARLEAIMGTLDLCKKNTGAKAKARAAPKAAAAAVPEPVLLAPEFVKEASEHAKTIEPRPAAALAESATDELMKAMEPDVSYSCTECRVGGMVAGYGYCRLSV